VLLTLQLLLAFVQKEPGDRMYFPKRDPLRLAAQGMIRIVIYDVDVVVK